MPGICLDALNAAGAPSLEELRASGADGARLVAHNDDRFFGYHHMLRVVGATTAVVLARESFPDDDYEAWAGWYAARCTPTWWVIGNEEDAGLLPEESPSSWKMDALTYADLWHQCAIGILRVQPQAQLAVGGLVSGQVWYLENLLPLLNPAPDAVDVHPYNQTVDSARALLQAYKALL